MSVEKGSRQRLPFFFMTTQRTVGQPTFFNCLCAVLLLLVKRRLCGLLVRLEWCPHFLGVTTRGNLIHFKTTRKHDGCKPLFFEGQYVVRRLQVVNRPGWLSFRWR